MSDPRPGNPGRDAASPPDRPEPARLDRSIDAVLFDMDGTLTVPILDFVKIKQAVGCPQEIPILEWMKGLPAAEQSRVEARLIEFEIDAARNAVPADGAARTVAWLAGQGYQLGIITRNCMQAVAITLQRCKLPIECLWTREDRPHKPSGQAVTGLCRRMNVDPERSVVVGDYKFDLEAARQAGAAAVLLALKSPLPDWASLADAVIWRLEELRHLLRKDP